MTGREGHGHVPGRDHGGHDHALEKGHGGHDLVPRREHGGHDLVLQSDIEDHLLTDVTMGIVVGTLSTLALLVLLPWAPLPADPPLMQSHHLRIGTGVLSCACSYLPK